MPMTPCHFGPGALIKAAVPRHFSWTMFALANVAIDLEPILFYAFTGDPVHGYLHTLIGATVLALVCAVLGRPLCLWWLRQWNARLSPAQARWLGSGLDITRPVALASALIGTWSHIGLDCLMHPDVRPFWPYSETNAFRGLVPLDDLHLFCVASALLGLAWLGIRRLWPTASAFNPPWLLAYGRPWNLATLAIGLALLIAGAYYYHYVDWDVGVSVVMALTTYLTAPWALTTVVRRRWRWFPLAVCYAWLSVDGVYWAWHSYAGNEMLRDAQWSTSLCLWLLCGVIWYPRQGLRLGPARAENA